MEWLTELININYVLGRENEDELGLTCQLGKCSFYNKGLVNIISIVTSYTRNILKREMIFEHNFLTTILTILCI